MIKLLRNRTATGVPTSCRGSNKVRREFLLLRSKRDRAEPSKGIWKSAKPTLRGDTSGKCAYCESQASASAHCDVEHFRPVSKYWWLSYCFDNWLYSCQICNEHYKKDNFPREGPKLVEPSLPKPARDSSLHRIAGELAPDPLDGEPRHTLATFNESCNRERPTLIHPYVSNAEHYFAWDADAALKEVAVIPRNNLAATIRVFNACERFYGLNREELCGSRWITYETLNQIRIVLSEPQTVVGRQAAIAIVRLHISGKAPYAAMSRYFVQLWQLPTA